LAHIKFKGATDDGHIDIPVREDISEGVIIDDGDIKVVTALVGDGFDGEIEIGLINVVATSFEEVFPMAGVPFSFDVYPYHWFLHIWAILMFHFAQVFLDLLVIIEHDIMIVPCSREFMICIIIMIEETET